MSEDETYEIEQIIRCRKNHGTVEYLVKFVGYDELEWVPKENFNNDGDILIDFEMKTVLQSRAKKTIIGIIDTAPENEVIYNVKIGNQYISIEGKYLVMYNPTLLNNYIYKCIK